MVKIRLEKGKSVTTRQNKRIRTRERGNGQKMILNHTNGKSGGRFLLILKFRIRK